MYEILAAMHQKNSLVRFFDALQLVNKNRSCALSTEQSLFTNSTDYAKTNLFSGHVFRQFKGFIICYLGCQLPTLIYHLFICVFFDGLFAFLIKKCLFILARDNSYH